ncbi:hypothetical protein [Pseudomonas sp. UM16]|uniref:hypothetical protein n=1 Tax=Pseudomonas sp. UM16 TaxID=3158962 RepID=UPI00398F99B0
MKKLKEVSASFPGVIASRNKLKFKYEKKVVAELVFEHLARVDAYVLVGLVYGGSLFDCASHYTPPYKSNLFGGAGFSFTTSGDRGKIFSGDFGGAIKTPDSVSLRSVCDHIGSVLEDFYIPMVLGCIAPTGRTIRDVLSAPDNYAYPAVFVHCAMSLCPGLVSEQELSEVLSCKEIVKNKGYDLPLLALK